MGRHRHSDNNGKRKEITGPMNSKRILLLLWCSAAKRVESAFTAGAFPLGYKARNEFTKLNSQVSERTLPVSLRLAEEWAARNKGFTDDYTPIPLQVSHPPPDTYSLPLPPPPASRETPLPIESPTEPNAGTSRSMSDLALEWASRNREVDTINGEVSMHADSLSSSVESAQVQHSSSTDTAGESETLSFDVPTTTKVEIRFDKITSVGKNLWLDEETSRFYEGPSIMSDDDALLAQISTLKRFEASHGGYETLQKQLEDLNSAVEGEGQYAVADGELVKTLTSSEVNQATLAAIREALTLNERLTDEERIALEAVRTKLLAKPRPYPLFLAEKAAEVVESSTSKMLKPFKARPKAKPVYYETEGKSYTRVETRDGRKRIVILGSGWGAASFLKEIDSDLYDVTVISPRNHFVFTPMLAGASVGTVEYRSITEPIREINRQARYLEGIATDVDPDAQKVTCQSVICDGNSCDICEFTVSYDQLVITVGAQTNTFGTPGVREYCCFLKQVEDARRIRTAIVNCFERANLPGLTEEERKHDLTFAVVGAGPTGVEFAAELRDFVEQDGPKYYPNLVKYVRIKVIVSSSTILAPFDKSLQEEAIQQMNKVTRIKDPALRSLLPARFKLMELLFESRVTEVTEKHVILKDGTEIPYGLALWAAGNGPIPLTLHVVEALGEEQENEQEVARGRIAVDPWLRAVGGKGKILAFGDCSCICQGGQQLPATAQVASQQGEYLATLMNRRFDLRPTSVLSDGILPPPVRDPKRTAAVLSDRIAGLSTKTTEYAKPFQFLNLGILAYTGGGSALAQVETAPEVPPVLGWGKVGNLLWRSVYLSKQVSWRNRLLVLNDWTKKQLFGRDITRV